MNGTIVKNYLPALGLINAAVQWFKPHKFIHFKTSQSLMLLLCRNYKLIVPTVVLSSFWIFDSHDSEYTFFELTLSRRVRSLFRLPFVLEFDDDDDEDNETNDDEDNEGYGDDEDNDENSVGFGSYDDEDDYVDNERFDRDDHEDDDENKSDFDDDDEKDKDTINSCTYMEEFNLAVDVVHHYDFPLGIFGFYMEHN